jgi:hypothetical protein
MSLAKCAALLFTLRAITAFAQLPPLTPPSWWIEPAPPSPRPAPEAQEYIDLAFMWSDRDAIPEALDALITAISYDPTARIAWRALRGVRLEQDWRTRNVRILQEYPLLDAVLTCGDPERWPRFAVIACGHSYMQFAQDLEQRGRHQDASRYRRILAQTLISHGASAFDGRASACVLSFFSLSDSVQPFALRDRDYQVSLYRVLAVAANDVQNHLLALDALGKIVDLDALTAVDRRLMSVIAQAAQRDISWDSSSGLLRTFDPGDFFDSRAAREERETHGATTSIAEQGTSLPYGMTSGEEDFATLGEIRSCDCPDFDKVMDDRLAIRNLELPVKGALYLARLVSESDPSDKLYEPEMHQQLPQMLDRIGVAIGTGDDVSDRTLIGYEIARRISAILTRANTSR